MELMYPLMPAMRKSQTKNLQNQKGNICGLLGEDQRAISLLIRFASPSNREKSKAIYIKVSPKELQTIRERMESVGIQNLSAYMLKMAMNGFVIQLDLSDMKEVLRLRKINSNNLNQYAKKANEIGSIYKEDIKELMAIHKELLQMLGEMLERLGNIE